MSVLADIVAGVREDLTVRQERVGLDTLKAKVATMDSAIDPRGSFRDAGISLIAEVKRASPSKGELADIPDPAELARAYAAGGATAISVLTEQRRFRGSLDDLVDVRRAVDCAVLRKDFIVTAYQLFEARAAGADLVLLIVAALTDAELTGLVERARSIGLTPLVEAHTRTEIERAVDAGADVIGINNRDLTTLEVDPSTFARLAPVVPDGIVRVAESGVRTPHDVIELSHQGADVVLVGEALVTDGDPGAVVADMVAAGAHPALRRRP